MTLGQVDAPTARVSVSSSGALLLNALPTDMDSIQAELQRLKAVHGEVWFYRENPLTPGHAHADQVFDLILENRLPVMLASKPDFSEYFDNHGLSQ